MGNVYMEADQIRYKGQYRTVQEALDNGGGGGGTTVVANPEGSATADLSKLQVGTTIYDIPMPGVATTSAAGIVQPDGTTITINNGVISAPEGGVPVTGTTNVPEITWIRRGALVLVSCYGVDFTSQSSLTITGLPAPVNNAYVLQALMHNEYVGNIQYINNSWIASLKSSNDKLGYAGFVYLAADN